MAYVILAVLALAVGLIAPWFVPPNTPPIVRPLVRYIALAWAAFFVLDTSIIHVPADQVGVVRKIYGVSAMPEGHIIAADGETGYQAQLIPPGTFRIRPFFNVLNDVTNMPIVYVPQGFYGRIVARDGENLRNGQIMADAWHDTEFGNMLDAQYFMTHHGQRGLQLSILKPGTYPINLMLYQVKVGFIANGRDTTKNNDAVYDETGFHNEETPLDTSITHVPAGFVGVVRSSVQDPTSNCAVIKAKVDTKADPDITDSLTADLVPQNCKGVWSYALPPNDYYLNRDAYDVTLVDTRVQTLEFKGGFVRRQIALKVNSHGDFEQTETSAQVPVEQGAADQAVNTKVEGWEIPQELRAVVQISPQNAPIIVAAVGGLKEVETRIMVPSIRSHVRNVYGGQINITEGTSTVTRPTRVLDTIEQRPALEAEILARVQEDGRRAGVDVKEIRLGESVIPPELLLARQRQQLAEQLKAAFIQEQAAQGQRQLVEAARATADQQGGLVAAQIGVQTANLGKQKREAEGAGERLYLEQIAAGQKAQTEVLGQEKVFMFNMADKIVTLLTAHPEIIAGQKWPLFIGGSSLENAAGLLTGTQGVANGAGIEAKR
jgi:hypothetical protein